MTGIQCNQGHVFSMIIDSESEKAIWKLEECYYMSQGCEVIKQDELKFDNRTVDCCPHCSILEHDFEELIEEITNEKSNYFKSKEFEDNYRKQVEKDTWEKGLPMIYMNEKKQFVEHWKNGEINIVRDAENGSNKI